MIQFKAPADDVVEKAFKSAAIGRTYQKTADCTHSFRVNEGDEVNGEMSDDAARAARLGDGAGRGVEPRRVDGRLRRGDAPAPQRVLGVQLVPGAEQAQRAVRLEQQVRRQTRDAVRGRVRLDHAPCRQVKIQESDAMEKPEDPNSSGSWTISHIDPCSYSFCLFIQESRNSPNTIHRQNTTNVLLHLK